jgi:hypothetical protein
MQHALPTYHPWFGRHITFGEKYKCWSSSLCNFLQPPITSFLPGPNILLSTPFSNTVQIYVLPLMSATKFHTHTNQQVQLRLCILSRVWVTVDGVWIGDWIYWTRTHTTRNNSLTGLQITNCSTHKVFYVFISRFLVTDPDNVPCLRSYRLANIPQLVQLKSKSKLFYDGRSSTNLGLTTRFLLLSDSCGFVDVGRSLWRENGSALYNCCWSLPAQSFLGPSPAGLVTIFYSLWFTSKSKSHCDWRSVNQ